MPEEIDDKEYKANCECVCGSAQLQDREYLSLISGATPITRSLGLADYRVRMISRAIAYAHAFARHA